MKVRMAFLTEASSSTMRMRLGKGKKERSSRPFGRRDDWPSGLIKSLFPVVWLEIK